MSEMIKRVAQAIWYAEFPNGHPEWAEWDRCLESDRSLSRERARAAIEAMREPTDDMASAGIGVYECANSIVIWQAMIDAALKEKS